MSVPIEEALFSQASTFAGLTALIGASPSRFYPGLMPQDPAYPGCTYQAISAPRESAMGSDPGIVHGRFQIDCWATTRTGARDLAGQVRAAFQRWRGTVAGVVVMDTFIDNEQDVGAELVNNIPIHRRIVDIIVHYRE